MPSKQSYKDALLLFDKDTAFTLRHYAEVISPLHSTESNLNLLIAYNKEDRESVNEYISMYFSGREVELIEAYDVLTFMSYSTIASHIAVDPSDYLFVSCDKTISSVHELLKKLVVILDIAPDFILLDSTSFYLYEAYSMLRKYLGKTLADIQYTTPLINPLTSYSNETTFIDTIKLNKITTINKMVMSIPTDSYNSISYNPIEQPTISMILQLLGRFKSKSIESVILDYERSKYSDLKNDLINEILNINSANTI